MTNARSPDAAVTAGDPTKRDFIFILTGAVAVGGVAAVAWPFIDQMNPASDTLALGSPMTVDLSKI